MTIHPTTIALAGALCLGLAALSLPAAEAAEAGVKAGVLKCDVGAGMGFIFGSSRDVTCLYTPNEEGETEQYIGEIKKFGVDIGYKKSGVMLWGVVAPSADMKSGALAGTYAGATAEAAVGAGAGANVLVGGGNSIALQPVSITGAEGLNIAAGLGVLELKEKK